MRKKARDMPKKLQKSIQDYLSKIKKQTPHLQFSPSSLSHTTSKIFSGCKHPKSLSFSVDPKDGKEGEEVAATLEDIDRFLIENFKSLYGQDDDSHGAKYEEDNNKHVTPKGGSTFESPRIFTPPPDLYGSHRFLVSPSSSSSVPEETLWNSTGTSNPAEDAGSTSAEDSRAHQDEHDTNIPRGVEDCIAVLTVSQSPYEDYRRSMQQVIEARVHHKQRVDWDFMEDILFCYLRLNEKKQYRYILSAFIDLVVTLRQIPTHGSTTSDTQNNSGTSANKGKQTEYF